MKHLVFYGILLIAMSSCKVSAKAPTHLTEADYYKAMYEQASEYSASSINTAWYAITVIAALFPIILALQYIANSKISRQRLKASEEKNAQLINSLRQELNNLIAEKTADTNRSIDSRLEAQQVLIKDIQRELTYLSFANQYTSDTTSALHNFILFAKQLLTLKTFDTSVFAKLSNFIENKCVGIELENSYFDDLKTIINVAQVATTGVVPTINGGVPAFAVDMIKNAAAKLKVYRINSEGVKVLVMNEYEK